MEVERFLHFWIDLYAFASVVPYFWFFLIWAAVYYFRRDGKRATKLAMDITTLLLIGSVSSMYYSLFHSRFGFFMIVLFFLIGYGLAGNYQYRLRGAVNHARIIRMIWRLAFLGLSAVYLLFLAAGLIKAVLSI